MGSSEARALDRVEASRRIDVVMVGGDDRQHRRRPFQHTRGEFEDGVLVIHNQNARQGLFHHMTVCVI